MKGQDDAYQSSEDENIGLDSYSLLRKVEGIVPLEVCDQGLASFSRLNILKQLKRCWKKTRVELTLLQRA